MFDETKRGQGGEGANSPEFKYGTEQELIQEAEKIQGNLAPFLGAEYASMVSEYLLDAAKRMDSNLKFLLSQKAVAENAHYDGDIFILKDGSSIPAPNGLSMLRETNSYHIKAFFGSVKPPEPAPDIYEKCVEKMFDFLATGFVNRTEILIGTLEDTGDIKYPLYNVMMKKYLSGRTPEESEFELGEMKESQIQGRARAAAAKDNFWKDFERQLSEDPD